MDEPRESRGVSLLDCVRRHALDANFFQPGSRVLVAVSGGPDSVTLLLLLCELAVDLGIEPHLGHVDHGILSESGDLAKVVMELADRVGVRGHLVSLNLGPGASETLARRERYRALRRIQGEIGARYLATAHHADDQIETVLFRLLRGSGVSGLSGIQAKGPGGLVRPLLPWRKSELTDWLEGHAITRASGGWATLAHRDPSNEDLRHDRAWVRTVLLPVLCERFGAVVQERVLATASAAGADRQAWSAVLRALPELEFHAANGFAQVARAPLLRYHHTLTEALLQALAREVGCVLGPRKAQRLRSQIISAKSGRSYQLGRGWEAELAFGHLRILHPKEAGMASNPGTVAWGPTSGEANWGRWTITWRPDMAGPSGRKDWMTWVTEGIGEIRGPHAGDRLLPLGGVGHRRVSRLLMEGRIPRSTRPFYPVIVRGEEILWLPGLCRAGVAVPRVGEWAIRMDARFTGDST